MIDYELSAEEQRLFAGALEQLEFPQLLEYLSKYAMSETGKQEILSLEPLDNLAFLIEEHQSVDEITNVITTEEPIPFETMDNVTQKFHKSLVTNAVLTAGEILKIRDVIRLSRIMKGYFSLRDEKYPTLWNLLNNLHENKLLEKHIADAISENGEIKDSASRELSSIRSAIIEKSARLRNKLEKILSRVAKEDMLTEEFISVRDGRYVIPVKAEHKRHIPGIIHNVSQTGQTVFLEPSETFEMNNEISLLMSEEKREIYRILQNLTKEIGSEAREFLQSFEILTHFDSLFARAKYALDFGGIKPQISEENEIVLSKIKHPILCHTKGSKNVIPLSSDYNDKKRGQLISGPNAGGKTVALKSMGINIAMALSGIFPIGEVKTNFRMIFCSIGDNQSIENDLSTFSSQVLQLKNILDAASSRSFILIDEICSGTDPQEGAALAAGILDTFISLNCFFIVTTHQSSLKTYSLNRDEIQNASLEFDVQKLKPTYKYLSGIPGNSYAFALAESLGVNRLVLERAHNYLGSSHSELEKSISMLQKFKQEYEELRLKAESEKLKAEKLRKDYEIRLKEIKLRKKELIDKAHQEAVEVLSGANSLIEKTIKEIREEKKAATEIRSEFNEQKAKIERKVKQKSINLPQEVSGELKIGDTVTLEDSESSVGTILFIDDNGKMGLVDFNGVKFRMALNQLVKAKKKKELRKEYTDYLKFDIISRIDFRGKRAEESIRELDDRLNDAIVSNVQRITIIHGKGTGALRAAIHNFLDEHPSVTSYRIGDLQEGGDGVTIVEL